MQPSLKTIEVPNFPNLRISILEDEWDTSPRYWNPQSRISIAKHRNYNFPNEHDIDFDEEIDNAIKGLGKENHVFFLDMYKHSEISFSRSGAGMQCRFDTTKNIGIATVPLLDTTIEQAIVMIDKDLQEFNNYCNGTGLWKALVERKTTWTSDTGRVRVEREGIYDDDCQSPLYGMQGDYNEKEEIDNILSHFDFNSLITSINA